MSDDVQPQDQKDLPDHWTIKTSVNSEAHHDDSPLFPPIKEKELIQNTNEELIQSSTIEEPLLPSGSLDEDLLTSGKEELLLEQGDIEDVKSVEDALPEEDIIDTPNEVSVTNIEQSKSVDTEKSNEPELNDNYDNNSINIKETENIEEKQIVNDDKWKNDHVKNSTFVPVSKSIPVPHLKIIQAVDTKHPIASPPRVIPFATSAPAAHTRVASVYTQPDARASTWLPWMRTSMWTRKKVKKATRDPNISEMHAGLPVVSKDSKPNIVYSPVYINPEIKREVVNIKTFAPEIEKQAPVVRMNHEFVKAPDKIQDKISEPTVYTKPDVKDNLDNELFGKHINSSNEKLKVDPIVETKDNKANKSLIENPKIEDSWDAALFS